MAIKIIFTCDKCWAEIEMYANACGEYRCAGRMPPDDWYIDEYECLCPNCQNQRQRKGW